MIITLKGADFSSNNIGTLSTWSVSKSLGTGATYSGPTSVDKGASLSATVTIATGYELGSTGVTVTMGGVSGSYATVSGNTITIKISSVTGNVVIKVPTKNTSSGSEDSGSADSSIAGFTQQSLSYSSSDWAQATVTEAGLNSTSSNYRVSYRTPFTVPDSGEVMVTLSSNLYQWAIRSGPNTTTYTHNQYWCNSGDTLKVASQYSGSKMMLILRKISSAEDAFTSTVDNATISISDISTIEPKLYFKDSRTSVDTSAWTLVDTPNTDEDNVYLATVGTSGIDEDGSNTKRVSFLNVYDMSKLNNRMIMITCTDGYQWAIRNGSSETSFEYNQYWFNSGVPMRLSTQSGKYMVVLRKVNSLNDGSTATNDQPMAKSDAVTAGVKIYTITM